VAVNFGTATLEVNLPFEVKPLLEVGEAACLDDRARLGRHSAVVGVRS
jgi:hypothetical protein